MPRTDRRSNARVAPDNLRRWFAGSRVDRLVQDRLVAGCATCGRDVRAENSCSASNSRPEIGEHVADEGVHQPWVQVRVSPDEVPEAERLVVERQHQLPELVERPAHVALVVHERLGCHTAGVEAAVQPRRAAISPLLSAMNTPVEKTGSRNANASPARQKPLPPIDSAR